MSQPPRRVAEKETEVQGNFGWTHQEFDTEKKDVSNWSECTQKCCLGAKIRFKRRDFQSASATNMAFCWQEIRSKPNLVNMLLSRDAMQTHPKFATFKGSWGFMVPALVVGHPFEIWVESSLFLMSQYVLLVSWIWRCKVTSVCSWQIHTNPLNLFNSTNRLISTSHPDLWGVTACTPGNLGADFGPNGKSTHGQTKQAGYRIKQRSFDQWLKTENGISSTIHSSAVIKPLGSNIWTSDSLPQTISIFFWMPQRCEDVIKLSVVSSHKEIKLYQISTKAPRDPEAQACGKPMNNYCLPVVAERSFFSYPQITGFFHPGCNQTCQIWKCLVFFWHRNPRLQFEHQTVKESKSQNLRSMVWIF